MALFIIGLHHARLPLLFMSISGLHDTVPCSYHAVPCPYLSGLHDAVPCSYHWSVTLFQVSMTLSHVAITGLSRCSISISGPHHFVPVTESTTFSHSQTPPRCPSHRIHHVVPFIESATLSQSQNPPRCPIHRIHHVAPCPTDKGDLCVIVSLLSTLLCPWSVCRTHSL